MKDIRCRPAGAEDFTFLATMLGHAASRLRPPTAEQVLADPRYGIYLEGWPRPGDFGLIAEQDEPLGAAWYRICPAASHGYGYISDDVPELAIAVVASRRHRGVGRRLLVDLIEASVAHGHQALSLYSQVVRTHTGNGPHEQMDGRAVATFVLSMTPASRPARVCGFSSPPGSRGRPPCSITDGPPPTTCRPIFPCPP